MENKSNVLQLNASALEFLRESAKWSKFLAIIGFIGLGFMVLAAIFMGSILSFLPMANSANAGMPFGILSVVYILMAALYFFPIYYLYKYANNIKTALEIENEDLLAEGLGYLKSHHKFLGIMMIVVLSLYVLMFAGMIVFGIFAASGMH